MDQPITLHDITILVGAAVGIFGLIAGVFWRIHGRFQKIEDDLSSFRIEVAKTYVTDNAIKEVEDRISRSIDRLGDRLDAVLHHLVKKDK